jgi:hypothetical protein
MSPQHRKLQPNQRKPYDGAIKSSLKNARPAPVTSPAFKGPAPEPGLNDVTASDSLRFLFNWRWQALISIIIAAFFFVIYLVTANRSVPTGDSGELITAAWTLGVAHQPGYPTFTMLSHLAGCLPFGTPAFRMNLLSALLDALAAGVLSFGVFRLLQAGLAGFNRKASHLIPITGVIGGIGLLAVSTSFWRYSTVAEVFALNNFLAAIILVLMLEWVRQPSRKHLLWLSGLFSGLAVTNQLTIVLLAPGLFTLLILGLLRRRREARLSGQDSSSLNKTKSSALPWRDLGITAGFFLVGLLPYIYLPLAAKTDPAINFGDPSTFSNFWRVIMRSDYGTFSFTADSIQGNRFEQLYFIGRYFVQSFTPAGIVLFVLGIIWFIRRQHIEGIGLGLALLFSGPVFAMFANADLNTPITLGVFERFYILPSIPLAVFAAAGAALIIETAERLTARFRPAVLPYGIAVVGIIAAAAMIGGLIAGRLPSMDESRNRMVENYGQDLLEPLEPNALLIMNNDYNFGAALYSQLVLGLRTDVITIHAELLKATWYVDQQRRLHPEITIPFSRYDEGQQVSLADLVKANIGTRPVYRAGDFKEDLSTTYDEVYWGLTYKFLEKGKGPDPYAFLAAGNERFAGMHFPDKVYPDTFWESKITTQYGVLAFRIAFERQQAEAQPDADFVEQMYRTAIVYAPSQTGSYKNLGLLLWKNGGPKAEIISLWEKYLEIVPDDPQNSSIRSAMTMLKNQP